MRKLFLVASVGLATTALAEDELTHPVSELYVVTMNEAVLRNSVLTLTGLTTKVIWFTDGPERRSGVADTEVFATNWPKGDENFEVDPPNAILVGVDTNGNDFELPVELLEPEWVRDVLTVPVQALADPLPADLSLTEAHLFIDNSSDDNYVAIAWCWHACFYPTIGAVD